MKNKYHNQVDVFFEKNKQHLLSNYPGIKLSRLIQEVLDNQLDSEEKINSFFEELMRGRPLEYIFGKAFFYQSEFLVDERVLIPRSETEILVEKALEFSASMKQVKVIDVGTGSGAILLSYLKERQDHQDLAWACDISEEALAVAKKNTALMSLEGKVHFFESDRLSEIEEKFDVILTNPPYIKEHSDRAGVHHQVLNYEPAQALFLKDEGYEEWFELFFKQIKSQLKENGFSLMEGHENHLQKLKSLAHEVGFQKVEILKDYNNCDRFLYIRH